MNSNIYKTEEGKNIVVSTYSNIIAGYSLHPFKQFFIPTKIATTHLLKFGDQTKPPLIMIHGSVSNSAAWLGSISYFIDDFCVYCIDIPGEPGLSEPVRCSLDSEEPYQWLCSLIDYLDIKKAFFITMSLGSWYAINFAMHSPERVRALSMITSGGLVPAKKSFIYNAIFFMMLGKFGQKFINKLIYHKTQVPTEVLEFQAIASKYFNPVKEALPIFTDTQLKKLAFPIQFFGGDCDALIDSVKTAERLKNLLPHSDIHILRDTGHAIIDQFPAVKEFLISNLFS
jgi:pimeloyl-ACP methyl ester carboxylesterase